MKIGFTPSAMLAALASVAPLAWHLAAKFRATNPAVPLAELHAVATAAFKACACNFDPARGVKFSTVAFRYAWRALADFCRRESARGMHVPENHEPYYAPRPQPFAHDWQHPIMADDPTTTNELGDDFWRLVASDLCQPDSHVILRVYRDGVTQMAVAAELGITKSRVGQIHARALARLAGRDDLRELAGAGVEVRRERAA